MSEVRLVCFVRRCQKQGWQIYVLIQPWKEDLCASLNEDNWFDASLHKEEVDSLMRDYQGVRDLCCLDVFGFSGSMAKHWVKNGFTACQYDIALNPRSDDLLGKRGYLHLTRCLT